jgi:hypothetical protein
LALPVRLWAAGTNRQSSHAARGAIIRAPAITAVAAQVIDENASVKVATRVCRRRKWLRLACARNQT